MLDVVYVFWELIVLRLQQTCKHVITVHEITVMKTALDGDPSQRKESQLLKNEQGFSR